jgi:hypothetical protein
MRESTRAVPLLVSTMALLQACGSGSTERNTTSSTSSGTSMGAGGSPTSSASTGSPTSSGPSTGPGGSPTTAASSSTSSSSSSSSSGNGMWQAGNPNGSCSGGIPAAGQPASTSNPTTVVGTGSAASCTFSALQAAVAKGGVITFNCGSAPATIQVTATLEIPNDRDTVIDGGQKVTLDGGSAVRIMNWTEVDFQKSDHRLTLQHIALVNGKTTPTQAIPPAPAPCSQGWDDGEGGAIRIGDGNLTVIDSIFSGNQGAPLGPDVGGGAIYIIGSKHGALIVGSTFKNNKAANAGAIGGLFAELDIYNSEFTANSAIGHDANNDDPSKCSAMNNGQNETGSGGNGGAIYQDGGNATNIVLCGVDVTNNAAGTNAFGGGVFMTSNDWTGTISVIDSNVMGNTGGSWTQVMQGSVMNLGTAFGVNAKSATVTNSKLQM